MNDNSSKRKKYGHIWGIKHVWLLKKNTRFGCCFTTRHVLQFSNVDLDTFGGIGHVWGEGHISECYIYKHHKSIQIFKRHLQYTSLFNMRDNKSHILSYMLSF